jgi:signal transduction histidine kinase
VFRWSPSRSGTDVALAAAVLLLAASDVWSYAGSGDLSRPLWLAGLCLGSVGLLTLLRRHDPFVMTVGMAAVTLGWWALEGDPPIASAVTVGFAVAAYALGRHERRRGLAWTGLGVIVVGLALHLLLDSRVDSWDQVAAELPWDLLVVGMWLLGALLRYRELYDEGVRLAAAREERARIARELHDVAVHGLSMMVVQAEAADVLLEAGEPERARDSLNAISQLGRRSLDDLRASVSTLRGDDEGADRAPAPGLADLDGLVRQVRATGLDVEVATSGTAREVPAAVGLVAYRVVQESLTNALRHSRAGRADVQLDYRSDGLVVTVRDQGPAARAAAITPGSGLRGMAERVRAVGGRLRTTGGGRDGFTVVAELPWGRA